MEDMIGEIKIWSGTKIPNNWLLCDGREISIDQYSTLHNVIGFLYGGDVSKKTFKVPDLREVFIKGAKTKNSVGAIEGSPTATFKGVVAAAIQVNEDNLPAHTHQATFSFSPPATGNKIDISIPVNDQANSDTGIPSPAHILGKILTGGNGSLKGYSINTATSTLKPFSVNLPSVSGTVTNTSVGKGTPINLNVPFQGVVPIIPPAVSLNFIICWSGYYPMTE